MKKSIKTKIVVLSCVLGAIAAIHQTACAGWINSQGNVAQVERPYNCAYTYYGWGLDLTQNKGTENWIHLTVPSPRLQARYVHLMFYTGSTDAKVKVIDVYNGPWRVKTFNVNLYNGWIDQRFDLGSDMMFDKGMSFSVLIGAGNSTTLSHRFIFSNAGGYFIDPL